MPPFGSNAQWGFVLVFSNDEKISRNWKLIEIKKFN
jgi:hypothetical protein